MILLGKLATKHSLRVNSDGYILLRGASSIPVEIYLCCETEVCFYLAKSSLSRALIKLTNFGASIYQEGDIEVVIKFPEKSVDKVIKFIKEYRPNS